ncbi:MAG TPA: glycosyltransferase, partial [Candidatus Saccharimonadales bacterium]|nr:glycosyltransferase [Candidatus Saccharimonadales bacterium]
MKEPLVSVIITTKNEASNIERCVTSVVKQSYTSVEILMIDNNSTDSTVAIAKKFTPHVFTKGPERSAQRNYGAQKAKGKYVLFLDADMELTEKVIEECVEMFTVHRSSFTAKVGGIVIPEVSIGNTYWEKVKAFERSLYNEKGDEITDAARFFPKSVFEEVGGYDETITGPEDWDLPEMIKSKGYAISRISSPIYHHESISSLMSLVGKKYYYGLKAHTYMEKHKISSVNAKTLYFLRPVFYQQWRKYIQHPLLACGMIVMLTMEL